MTINMKKQGGGDLPLTYSSAMKEEHFCWVPTPSIFISHQKMRKEETMVKVTRKKTQDY